MAQPKLHQGKQSNEETWLHSPCCIKECREAEKIRIGVLRAEEIFGYIVLATLQYGVNQKE